MEHIFFLATLGDSLENAPPPWKVGVFILAMVFLLLLVYYWHAVCSSTSSLSSSHRDGDTPEQRHPTNNQHTSKQHARARFDHLYTADTTDEDLMVPLQFKTEIPEQHLTHQSQHNTESSPRGELESQDTPANDSLSISIDQV